jgi:MFS family permease
VYIPLVWRGGHGLFREYRGIPWQARLLIFLSFIPNVLIGFVYSDLSYFLPKIQGIAAGPPITVMGVTLVALSIPFGIFADRYGRRKMLVLGNVCSSLSLLGFALTTNFGLILMVAVLEGAGEAAFAVSVSALIAEKAGNEKRTAAFSLLAFLGWIAGAVGNYIIVSVPALQTFGFSFGQAHVFLYEVVAILSLSVTPFLFLVKEGSIFRGFKEILPRKSARVLAKFTGYSVLIAVGAGLFVPIIAYWFSAAYDVPDVVSLQFLGVSYVLTAFAVFMSPTLARRFGLVKATVITQASSTIFMVFIPSAPTFPVAASIYLVRVFLMNLSNPLTQSLIMGLVSPDERGMASGITASLWRLPNALSTFYGYYLISAGFLALPFYYATALYAIGITGFWFLFKGAKLPEEAAMAQAPIQSSSVPGPEVGR